MEQTPPEYQTEEFHETKCFREDDTHEYWSSPQLSDVEDEGEIFGEADD